MSKKRVECVDVSDDGVRSCGGKYLSLGKIYTVEKENAHQYWLQYGADATHMAWFNKDRFVEVKDADPTEVVAPAPTTTPEPSAPISTFDFDTYNNTLPGGFTFK